MVDEGNMPSLRLRLKRFAVLAACKQALERTEQHQAAGTVGGHDAPSETPNGYGRASTHWADRCPLISNSPSGSPPSCVPTTQPKTTGARPTKPAFRLGCEQTGVRARDPVSAITRSSDADGVVACQQSPCARGPRGRAIASPACGAGVGMDGLRDNGAGRGRRTSGR
jgi:hypothetical protein